MSPPAERHIWSQRPSPGSDSSKCWLESESRRDRSRRTFKVLLCLCSSLQSPSSLLRASTARLCSLCSWSFSFITCSSFFCRTFSCFWSLRCSSNCKETTAKSQLSQAHSPCSTSGPLSAHQLSVLLDDGFQLLLWSVEFVQALHQQHGFLPWRWASHVGNV